jgi:DNA-directed RNA polymerase subunit RPC12/RpoP
MANNISEMMACSGPGMHRLHDKHDMVAPCPTCGRHHFGPTEEIVDSSVSIISNPSPTLFQRLRGIACRRRGHAWGPYERVQTTHAQRCERCGSARVVVPLDQDRSAHEEGP